MSDDPEIRFLGDLQRLKIEPGDMFVLSIDDVLSHGMIKQIHEAWSEHLGGQHKLIVLGRGMRLGLVGPGGLDAAA